MFNVAHLLLELTFTASRFAHGCYSLGMLQDHVSLTPTLGILKNEQIYSPYSSCDTIDGNKLRMMK
jgi:hypothetical protein